MKKNDNKTGRILGRRMAREMSREELEQANGGAYAPRTYTLSYPADNDPSGPIWV